MSDEANEAMTGSTSYSRNTRGQFIAGGRPGPGRTPVRALRRIMEGSRLLTKERAISGLAVLHAAAPEAALRAAKIASKSRDEGHALRACELILNYSLGLPIARSLVGTASLDAASSPAEKRERLEHLLAKVRAACGSDAIPRVTTIDQPRDDTRGDDVG